MKILLFANTDWFLYNFRLALAQALRERGDDVVLVSPDGDYAIRLQAAGFRWVCFPLARRSLNPFTEMLAILRLVHLYRQEKPDIVHQFTVKCVLYGSLACHLLGFRSVVNSVDGLGYVFTEGPGARRYLRGLIQLLYRLALRRTWVIFTNLDDQAYFLQNKLVDPGRIALIHGPGVDTRRFSPRPEPEGTPVVILPARLLWDKGVGEFVQAARLLRGEGIRARFVLGGYMDPGNPSAIPVDQLEAWEKEGLVERWSWQDDITALIAQANIICLPSYREGMPRTLLEASASGRAIIASDVPGCRDVVRDGENGLLVPVRDSSALAKAIKILVQDPKLRQKFGKQGRIIIEREFSSEHIISEMLNIYQTVGQ